ncbi:exonuclease domain-containing protein [Nocardiopsis ansamitocini]|uniref:3'-5' exonuclease n=1 Tax=Nocardiopsis ansamitocini TaxID=1670832 RepID=A0A9W6P5A7_9ACTN|nr:exonuclease domain-containing protein [Nocardiopsis ansamitocini]GLU47334.1 3'-5' exonuclease [Nocardiopsis ansamitocini]
MRNRYAGNCRTCRTRVEAAAGTAARESGQWRVYCSEHTPVQDTGGRGGPPPRADHPGWHTGSLVGYDCETSSNLPREAFLVSAALVEPSGEARTWLVDPGEREIPAEAVAIHGITTERARDEGVPAGEALEEIAGLLAAHLAGADPVVIFNAPFDLTVLDEELARRDMPTLTRRLGTAPAPIIDPLVLDRGLAPYRKGPRNLGALCELYGVELREAHTATADAFACLQLSMDLASRYPEIAALSLAELHARQIEWAAAYAKQLQEWLDRSRPEHGRVIDGSWPA